MPGRGNTTTEPTNGVNMLGMDRNTGKPLSGVDHICQSIVDILTIMESAGAIARWEPRVRIDRINVLAVDIGKITILIIATDIETQQRLEFNNMELIF